MVELVSENRSFGGTQMVFSHSSETCGYDMTFAAFLPPQVADGPFRCSGISRA